MTTPDPQHHRKRTAFVWDIGEQEPSRDVARYHWRLGGHTGFADTRELAIRDLRNLGATHYMLVTSHDVIRECAIQTNL